VCECVENLKFVSINVNKFLYKCYIVIFIFFCMYISHLMPSLALENVKEYRGSNCQIWQ